MIDRDRFLENLDGVRERIARAAERAGRDPASVTIVAATKTVPSEPLRWAVEAGVVSIGENYVRELREKRPEVPGASWHYVGTLQRGNATQVADLADVVETVSGERAARRLAARAARAQRTLDALLEVDFTGERTGVPPEDAPGFADDVVALDGLRLTGLMTIAPLDPDPEAARPWFARLRELRDGIRERHPGVVETSMGMSLDYEVAVEEGATMVRIGTALFGPRPTERGGG
ncbi:MAG TPA: YggS family pyridoxal phosphate-dependent enzyme [Actinomycetota bacterium]